MDVQLLIHNEKGIFMPVIEEGITWETSRKGVPGKLTFSVLNDGILSIDNGNLVTFSINNKGIFQGFIFPKKYDKSNVIKVTAYDQLRYLKNKETYVYENRTASELVRIIATDFQLQVGNIEDTKFKIASRIEDEKTLFDIVQSSLDITLTNDKKIYVLYDDYGKLTLNDIESMKIDLLINEASVENFDYTSTIDNSYNKVKLAYDNEKSGKREIYIAQDSSNINQWGVLQYFETIEEGVNGKAKADALLSLYNKKTRNLSIKGALGDIRVRGGSSVVVALDLGDMKVQNYMMVEKVKHTFKENEHLMDLTLVGGEFIG